MAAMLSAWVGVGDLRIFVVTGGVRSVPTVCFTISWALQGGRFSPKQKDVSAEQGVQHAAGREFDTAAEWAAKLLKRW